MIIPNLRPTMKNVIILVLLAGYSLHLSAQHKDLITHYPDQAATHGTLDMPQQGDPRLMRAQFTPQSLTFGLTTPSQYAGLRAVVRDENQTAIMIKGTPDAIGRSGWKPQDLAKDFLYSAAPIMGIQQPDKEFILVHNEIDDIGQHHLKYQQYFNGIKVYGSEIKLHGTDGNINLLMGRYTNTPNIKTVPSISEAQAQQHAIAEVGGIIMPDHDAFDIFSVDPLVTELVIYEGRLAYHHTIYHNLRDRYEVFVDAQDGTTIKQYKSICQFHNHNIGHKTVAHHTCDHSHVDSDDAILKPQGDETASATDLLGVNRLIHTYSANGTFYMIDASRPDMFNTLSNMPNEPEGTIWTIDAFNTSPQNNGFNYDHVTSFNNSWSSAPEAVSSQYNGALAYEYFLNQHARISINGQKGNIISFVNVADDQGNSMDNAFWNGFAMFYGNGSTAFFPLARGLDVAGHEMTHGVVQNTANLEYYGESGALNESFADVFGAMIDRDDWLIGEDVVRTSAFPSGALRSLIDPNQGQPTNSFGTGWQPKHMDEKFNGQEDNNGVHINSGIPNHAFFRFASVVGKTKAEAVYYRALDKYLVKSSQFIDARLAVIQAAQDLGLSGSEVQAARDAFDAVGVFDGDGGDYQEDIEINPGEDLIVYASEDLQSLSIMRPDGSLVAENFISVGVRSKPSVTDDGSSIVWVDANQQVHLAIIDWDAPTFTFQSGVLNVPGNENIRRVVVSREGKRIAVTTTNFDPFISVFDFPTGQWYDYELYNPTFSQNGEKTYDVAYADALEFDYTGDNIMYDARNEVDGSLGQIDYYDIGFLNIWNADANIPSLGTISKLFSGLPENVSVGNPTFSKNSDYIIAFDYGLLQENGDGTFSFTDFQIFGANLQTQEVNSIVNNNTFAFPSYSNNDLALVYTRIFEDNNPNTDFYDVAGVNLMSNKIEANGNAVIVKEQGLFATWFSNGERDLTDVEEVSSDANPNLVIRPNPVVESIELLYLGKNVDSASYRITDAHGQTLVNEQSVSIAENQTLNIFVGDWTPGVYYVTLLTDEGLSTTRFVKL